MDEKVTKERLSAMVDKIQEDLTRRRDMGRPISSEADTERLIIEKILEALGYENWEYDQHKTDTTTNRRPDYDVFYGANLRWMLEAKCFKEDLKVIDREQTVNYANNNGAEWAVLTNGRSWEIYNAHLPKPLMEKRVMHIGDLFSDTDGAENLLLLSRESMENGGLTRAWTQQRIAEVVKRELETPGSAIREHLCKIASKEIGVELDDAAIARAIADYRTIGIKAELNVVALTPKLTVDTPPSRSSRHVSPPMTATTTTGGETTDTYYTFEEIANNGALTAKSKNLPKRELKILKFSDGQIKYPEFWADVAKDVVEWIGQAYELPPLPFWRRGSEHPFLSSEVLHDKQGDELPCREVKVGTKTVYVHSQLGTPQRAASIAALLAAVGAPPDAVRIGFPR